jgi:hypothetical protein
VGDLVACEEDGGVGQELTVVVSGLLASEVKTGNSRSDHVAKGVILLPEKNGSSIRNLGVFRDSQRLVTVVENPSFDTIRSVHDASPACTNRQRPRSNNSKQQDEEDGEEIIDLAHSVDGKGFPLERGRLLRGLTD